jgi:hypothetical protein
MVNNFLENVRLFFRALGMTLRGESVKRPAGKLLDWIEQTKALSEAVLKAADDNGLDKKARESVVVKVDGRPQSMETILKTVRYHAQQEFPYMLNDQTEHTLTAIYAINMNDSYGVQCLAESEELRNPTVKAQVKKLATHLQAIPSSQNLEG